MWTYARFICILKMFCVKSDYALRKWGGALKRSPALARTLPTKTAALMPSVHSNRW